jgi:hypothetical protein
MRVGVVVNQILPKYIKCMYTHWIKYCDHELHRGAVYVRRMLTNVSKMKVLTVLMGSGVLKLRSSTYTGTRTE